MGEVISTSVPYCMVCEVGHKLLTNDVDKRLKEIVHQITADNGFTITEIESDLDHIHILIDCTPQQYIPSMIKALKGVLARLIFKEFPQLKQKLWGGHKRGER